jgi:2-oxoglutarate dehydrogenase E1 component
MGPWTFVDRRLHYVLEEIGHKTGLAYYVGRISAAAPATGSHKNHVEEQARLVDQALSADVAKLPQPFARATKLGGMVPPQKATA